MRTRRVVKEGKQMPPWAAIAFLAAVFLVGLYGVLQNARRALSPDGTVLEQLRRAGSDLTSPHTVDFFLVLPSAASAAAVAAELAKQGYEVAHLPAGEKWMCKATRILVPEESALKALRSQMSSLAHEHGGSYDGWGAGVVKA
jgi:hypothetical protein